MGPVIRRSRVWRRSRRRGPFRTGRVSGCSTSTTSFPSPSTGRCGSRRSTTRPPGGGRCGRNGTWWVSSPNRAATRPGPPPRSLQRPTPSMSSGPVSNPTLPCRRYERPPSSPSATDNWKCWNAGQPSWSRRSGPLNTTSTGLPAPNSPVSPPCSPGLHPRRSSGSTPRTCSPTVWRRRCRSPDPESGTPVGCCSGSH